MVHPPTDYSMPLQMFEGTYSPPLYNDLYDFKDGAQNYIFETSTRVSVRDAHRGRASVKLHRLIVLCKPTPFFLE